MTTPETSPLYVSSLANGLSVLDVFGPSRTSMNLPEIAAAAGITRSAAQRFTHTLESLGLLYKDPVSKKYSLSARTLDIGCRFLDSHPLLARANPYLLELCRETGETINFAEPFGLEMIYIGRFQNPSRLFVHMPAGRRLPMYCSSAGRMYLASLLEEDARELLDASQKVKYTPDTLIDINDLMLDIQQIRERGFALCKGEYYLDDLALAVPVYDGNLKVVACLQISVSAARWSVEQATNSLLPLMRETARLISTTPPSLSASAPFKKMPHHL